MNTTIANPSSAGGTQEPHGPPTGSTHHYVNYYLIFLILIALTAVTVMVASKRFPNELVNVLLALLIASIKAICVARYFMHLKFEGRLIHAILFVPVMLAVILTVALIPDIGLGRTTDFNDVIGYFEKMVHGMVG